jgi:hypothetical protein
MAEECLYLLEPPRAAVPPIEERDGAGVAECVWCDVAGDAGCSQVSLEWYAP